MANRSGDKPPLAVVDEVRCLDCGQVYAKPAGGGTVRANPGCPRCGYVGWLSVAIPVSGDGEQHHFGVSPQPHRSLRSG